MMNVANIVKANKRRATHGMYKSREYRAWLGMWQRCANPNNDRYARYGGRGIKVCARWKTFATFIADMGRAPKGTTLDRLNNDGNYTPKNCQWRTKVQQANNRTTNVSITTKGKTLTLAEWAKRTGLPYHVVKYRHTAGWAPEDVIREENFQGTNTKHTVVFNGKEATIKEVHEATGIPKATLYWRLNNGVPLS